MDTTITNARMMKLLSEAFQQTPVVKSVHKIGDGQGYVSTVLSAHLEWPNSADLPSKVVFKIPVTDKLQNVNKGLTGDNTSSFSEDVIKEMVANANNIEGRAYEFLANQDGSVPPIPTPTLYLARRAFKYSADPDGALLIEDLSDTAAPPPNFVDGITEDQVFNIVEIVARLHAYSIRRTGWFESFDLNPFENILQEFVDLTRPMYEQIAKDWAHVFPYKFEDVAHLWDLQEMADLMDPKQTPLEVRVLCHGDLWMNNVLCTDSGLGTVAAQIDWQAAHAGSCGEDLARLLAFSTCTQLRRTKQEAVLRTYYKRMTELLEADPPFSYDGLVAEYEKHLTMQLTFFGGAAGFNVGEHGQAGKETPERKALFMKRAAEATGDALMLYAKRRTK